MISIQLTMILKDISICKWLNLQELYLNFKLNSETSFLHQPINNLNTQESVLLSIKSWENNKFLKEQTTQHINKTLNWSLRSKSWKPGLIKLMLFTLETKRKSRKSPTLNLKSEGMRFKLLKIAKKLSKLSPQQKPERQLLDNLEDQIVVASSVVFD